MDYIRNNGLLLSHVSPQQPCPHCGKPDWCYFLGELSACKRSAEPAKGWKETSKTDNEGTYFYAPDTKKKAVSLSQKRIWEYLDRNGDRLIRVIRIDEKNGTKKIWQESWDGKKWIKGTKAIGSTPIPVYRYREIREAIAAGKRIFIVEGESCADALWKLGLPATTNIGGSGKWKPNNSEDLQGAEIILCPDRDQPGIKHMIQISQDFSNPGWLYAIPDSPFWNNLPSSGGLDIVDWLEEGISAEQILEAIETAPRVFLPSSDFELASNDHQETKHHSNLAVQFKKVSKLVGSDLRFNTLSQRIEFKGDPVYLKEIRLRIALDYDVDVSNRFVEDYIPLIADQNKYSPAEEYLGQVYGEYGANWDLLNNAAQEYLGIEDDLSAILIKRFLIGVTARVMSPGCQLDTCLILKGIQGSGKSMFFKELMPDPDWFDDSLSKDITNKDELAKLHRCVLMEWGEIEKAFSKRAAAEIKHFLTQKVDRYRPPYGREIELFKRASVIVGSTNKEEFLTDETGDRRFWVVEPKQIFLKKVERDRDRLWGAAVAAFISGEPWWLSPDEELRSSELKESFQVDHPWLEPVETYLETVGNFVEVNGILSHLGKEPHEWSRKDQMDVTSILTRLGWKKGRQYLNGKRTRIWYKA